MKLTRKKQDFEHGGTGLRDKFDNEIYEGSKLKDEYGKVRIMLWSPKLTWCLYDPETQDMEFANTEKVTKTLMLQSVYATEKREDTGSKR